MTLFVVLALVVSGCSGDDDEGGGGPDGTSTSPSRPPLTTTSEVTRITGALAKKRRKAVLENVTAVVDGWWDAAYLSAGKGDNAFPGFTRGAADLATRDRDIMTAAALPGHPDDPIATHRSVSLDILAVHDRPAGVTAHVWLALRPAPGERVVAVRGLLDLSRLDGEWRVFGYSMTAGPPPAKHDEQHGKEKQQKTKEHHAKKHHAKKHHDRKHHGKKHHAKTRAHHRKGTS